LKNKDFSKNHCCRCGILLQQLGGREQGPTLSPLMPLDCETGAIVGSQCDGAPLAGRARKGKPMFAALKDRVLITSATGWVHEAINTAVEEPLAGECSAVFVVTLKQDMKSGKLKPAIELFKRTELELDEIGVSLLDGVVTTLRQLMAGRASNADIDKIIGGLEATIDHIMLNSPGRILPRNGAFGRAADKTDLSKFFS
jgi:hypothetical protein